MLPYSYGKTAESAGLRSMTIIRIIQRFSILSESDRNQGIITCECSDNRKLRKLLSLHTKIRRSISCTPSL
jgi:hypothetical protein